MNKFWKRGILASALLLTAARTYAAPLSTLFAYEGQLKKDGVPLTDSVDFRFKLFPVASGGAAVGTQDKNNEEVTNGLFHVVLDFGDIFANGQVYWLEIEVAIPAGSGVFQMITPRYELHAVPYAHYAKETLHAQRALFADGPWATNAWGVYYYGNVGIGTAYPGNKLLVEANDAPDVIAAFSNSTDGSPQARTTAVMGVVRSSPLGHETGSESAAVRGINEGTGRCDPDGNPPPNYGIWGTALTCAGSGVYGTAHGQDGVGVEGEGPYAGVYGKSTAGGWGGLFSPRVAVSSGGRELRLRADGGDVDVESTTSDLFLHASGPNGNNRVIINPFGNEGNVGIGTGNPAAKLHVNGTARVNILEIIGADVAEKFPVSEPVEPGMVVEIDPENPGKLRLSRGAYNRRVAGVVSGAGDLSVGVVLGNLPGHEDAPPIAMSGRVWVRCDASNGPIEPGDLLTTSSTLGVAMKTDDYVRAQGASIGKAMGSLRQGEQGLILVLVNLQ